MHKLVTGAGGFLGGAIVRQLVARGDRVRALARRLTPELKRPGIELVLGDLRDAPAVEQACRGVDVVFHAAARPGIFGPWKDFYESNVVATRNVLAGCRNAGVECLVFTSSPSVTFDGRDQCGVDESAPYPTRWLSPYPETKAIAEQEVLAEAGRGKLLTCALRPHLIWGPGDRHLIPRLIERARAGRLRRIGRGENMIDTVFVENAAQAHLLAAEALRPGSPAVGKSYFISQGEPVNCWKWIDEILGLAGLPPVMRSMPAAVAYSAGAALEVAYRLVRAQSEPPMTRFLAAQLSTSHYFDISAARRDLGYVPAISHAEGMQQLAATLRAAVNPAPVSH